MYVGYNLQTTYSISKYDLDTLFDFQNRNDSIGWSCWDFVLSMLQEVHGHYFFFDSILHECTRKTHKLIRKNKHFLQRI